MIMSATNGHKFHPHLPSVAAPHADKGLPSNLPLDDTSSAAPPSAIGLFDVPGLDPQDWIDTNLFDFDDEGPSAFTVSDPYIKGLAAMGSDNKRRMEDVEDWANYLEASSSTTPGGPSPFSAASPFMSTHTSSSATSPRLTSPVGPLAHSFGGTTTGRLSASESPMFAPFVVPESMPPPPMARATRSTGTSPVMPVAGMHGLQVAGRAPHDRLSAQLTDAQLDAIARAASSPQEAYAQGVLAGLTPDLAETFAKAVGGPAGTGDVPGPAPSNLARRMRQDQRYASQTAASTVVSMGEPADAAGDINSNIDWDTFAATGNFYARQQDAAPFDARPAFPLQVASVPERPRMHQHTQSSDLYSYIMSAGLNSAMPASAPADMPIAPPPSKRLKERAPSKRSSTSRSPKAQARISASPGPFSTSATDNGSADERAAGGDAAKDPVKQARRREINRKSAQTMRLKRKEQLKEAELARDEAEHARKEAEARVKQLEDMLQSETRKRMLAEDRLRQDGHFVPQDGFPSTQFD